MCNIFKNSCFLGELRGSRWYQRWTQLSSKILYFLLSEILNTKIYKQFINTIRLPLGNSLMHTNWND